MGLLDDLEVAGAVRPRHPATLVVELVGDDRAPGVRRRRGGGGDRRGRVVQRIGVNTALAALFGAAVGGLLVDAGLALGGRVAREEVTERLLQRVLCAELAA